jgi:hypothetical protein
MAAGETVWWIVTDTNGNIKVISVAAGSAADKALRSSNPQTVIAGTDYIALDSPFASAAAAGAALPGIKKFEQGTGPGKPTVPPFALGPNQPAGQDAQQAAADAAAAAKAAANPLLDVAAALKAFFSAVTDYKMWRSVAWIMLGLFLMVNGILLWLRIPQRAAGIASRVGGAAAKAAI